MHFVFYISGISLLTWSGYPGDSKYLLVDDVDEHWIALIILQSEPYKCGTSSSAGAVNQFYMYIMNQAIVWN